MLFAQGTSKSNELFDPQMGRTIQEAVPFLDHLAREPAFAAWLLPLLERESEGWYVAHPGDALDGSYSLQVFVWPPGTRTRIHDHSSWGAYHCALGTIFEERYERLDDGSRHEHARLHEVWRLPWGPRAVTSTLLPGDGGIHRVGNPYGEAAISVHLYGPRTGEVNGRDYDPTRDYVCDRLEDRRDEFGWGVGEIEEVM